MFIIVDLCALVLGVFCYSDTLSLYINTGFSMLFEEVLECSCVALNIVGRACAFKIEIMSLYYFTIDKKIKSFKQHTFAILLH